MSEHTKVVFIDDEENIRRLVGYNLQLDGFNVLLAEDGKTGLDLVRKEKPRLVLLDIMMPGMDGLEVLSALKNDKTTKDIIVFMLTVKGMMRDVERAFSIGADNYITKPFDPENLGHIIKKKLKKFQP